MTGAPKNVCINKLDDIVDICNNKFHSTIQMKPADVKSSRYVGFIIENYDKNPKFKVSGYVRISKYKNIFAKGCTPNWPEEVLVIKKVKNIVLWTYY